MRQLHRIHRNETSQPRRNVLRTESKSEAVCDFDFSERCRRALHHRRFGRRTNEAGAPVTIKEARDNSTQRPSSGRRSQLAGLYPLPDFALGLRPGRRDSQPAWSIRIGIKGPERLDRPNYPPATLDPIDVTREGTNDEWTYRAKDDATGADVAVHIARDPCSPADAAGAKYTFRAVAQHAQLGTLNGCARIAAELFPKINNQPDPDDATKLPDPRRRHHQVPVAHRHRLRRRHKSRRRYRQNSQTAAQDGSEPALSTTARNSSIRAPTQNQPDRTIVLYDTTTGRSQDLVHGGVREAFWSPDDARVAYLNFQDQKWQLYIFNAAAPQQGTPVFTGSLTSLHGWVDAHTLARQRHAKRLLDHRRRPHHANVPLKEIYGNDFDIAGSDTLRLNPINPDLLLVSAPYVKAPAGAPTDQMGLAAAVFLYEIRSKRRTLMTPSDQWARHGEWSRDGVQVSTPAASPPRPTSFTANSGMPANPSATRKPPTWSVRQINSATRSVISPRSVVSREKGVDPKRPSSIESPPSSAHVRF